MQARNIPKAAVFVILGGGGDLTRRKLIPARDGRAWVRPTFLQCRGDMATCRVAMEPQE